MWRVGCFSFAWLAASSFQRHVVDDVVLLDQLGPELGHFSRDHRLVLAGVLEFVAELGAPDLERPLGGVFVAQAVAGLLLLVVVRRRRLVLAVAGGALLARLVRVVVVVAGVGKVRLDVARGARATSALEANTVVAHILWGNGRLAV